MLCITVHVDSNTHSTGTAYNLSITEGAANYPPANLKTQGRCNLNRANARLTNNTINNLVNIYSFYSPKEILVVTEYRRIPKKNHTHAHTQSDVVVSRMSVCQYTFKIIQAQEVRNVTTVQPI